MNNSKVSIFVSRSLDVNSELSHFSKSIDAHIDAFSLIEFTSLPFTLPTESWLFFYSKSGVRHFFNQINPEIAINAYKFASFGTSTGRYLENIVGRPINFCGDANAKSVSSSLTKLIGENAICFVVGKQSLRSVQSVIPPSISCSEIIVYDNQPLTSASLRHYDMAVITSPMNVATFIGSGGTADHYISIGSTTSESMIERGLNPIQASHPSEAGLATILKSVYKDYYYGNTK